MCLEPIYYLLKQYLKLEIVYKCCFDSMRHSSDNSISSKSLTFLFKLLVLSFLFVLNVFDILLLALWSKIFQLSILSIIIEYLGFFTEYKMH